MTHDPSPRTSPRRLSSRSPLVGSLAVLLSCASAGAEAPLPPYTTVKTIALGAPDRWDYLFFEKGSGRIYVAHGDRVDAVDGSSGTVLGHVGGILGGPHGIAVSGPLGFTDDGHAGTAVPFDAATFKTKTGIETVADADALLLDPTSGNLFVIGGDPGTIGVVDPKGPSVVRTIDVGGKLEYAVAEDGGRLYVNGEANREIVRVDTRALRVDARWPIPDCASPHGLAIDTASRRLFAGCVNERMVVVDADSGAVVATLPIGRGSDGIAFDPKRRRILSANGMDGTLSVIREIDANTYVALKPVTTMVSGRTLTIDPVSGRVYIAAADTDPAKTPGGRAVPRPGTLHLLVLDPTP